jgi:hypothetical protein
LLSRLENIKGYITAIAVCVVQTGLAWPALTSRALLYRLEKVIIIRSGLSADGLKIGEVHETDISTK